MTIRITVLIVLPLTERDVAGERERERKEAGGRSNQHGSLLFAIVGHRLPLAKDQSDRLVTGHLQHTKKSFVSQTALDGFFLFR